MELPKEIQYMVFACFLEARGTGNYSTFRYTDQSALSMARDLQILALDFYGMSHADDGLPGPV